MLNNNSILILYKIIIPFLTRHNHVCDISFYTVIDVNFQQQRSFLRFIFTGFQLMQKPLLSNNLNLSRFISEDKKKITKVVFISKIIKMYLFIYSRCLGKTEMHLATRNSRRSLALCQASTAYQPFPVELQICSQLQAYVMSCLT